MLLNKPFAALFIGAVLLAACTGAQSPQVRLAATCQAYASTLASLASVKDEMTDEQIAAVDATRTIVNPLCLSDQAPDDTLEALRAVRDELRRLNRIENEVTS